MIKYGKNNEPLIMVPVDWTKNDFTVFVLGKEEGEYKPIRSWFNEKYNWDIMNGKASEGSEIRLSTWSNEDR